MHYQSFKILATCAVLLSCSSHVADEKPATSAYEDFQHMQTIIRNVYCPETQHSEIQKELVEIAKNDQAERMTPTPEMTANDIKQRARVAAIAAQACLKDKDDYFTAAIVFQHGSLPEHYLQAIIYANKSAALGHPTGGSLREAAIDRYLMSLGYKQIFGSQVIAPVYYKEFESENDTIACLWPVEDNIDLVKDYSFGTQDYRIALRDTLASKNQNIAECDFPARDSSAMLKSLTEIKI